MDEQAFDHKDLNFKGQQPHERVVCFFRKHWITMLSHFVIFSVFVFLTLMIFVNLDALHSALGVGVFKFLFILIIAISFFYMHYFFLKLIEHFLTVAIVTNCRIVAITKTLFVIDEKESFDLKMIQEVNKHQNGILPNFLRYGDLTITLSQSAMVLKLTKIPNPEYHFRVINRAKEAHIQERMQMKLDLQQELLQRSLGGENIGTPGAGDASTGDDRGSPHSHNGSIAGFNGSNGHNGQQHDFLPENFVQGIEF